MALKLSELAKKTKTITIQLDEKDSLTITFKTHYNTPAFLEAHKEDKNFEILHEIITDWDFTDDEGKTLPVTKENTDQINFATITKILKAINEETLPNAETASN